MKARRFTASTMQKALKIVREQMGPDAVILSNHRVKGGVEIIVAENYEPKSANTVAPVYREDEQDGLPSPHFSRAEKKTAPVDSDPNNPWPFLSDTERKDVEDQLKLQEQLEALKQQRDSEQLPANSKSNAAALTTSKTNAPIDDYHDKIPGLGFKDTPQPLPTSFSDIVGGAAQPAVNSKEALRDALSNIKESRESGVPPAIAATAPATRPVNQDSFEARAHQQDLRQSELKQQEQQRLLEVEQQQHQQLIDDVRGELQDLKDLLKSSKPNEPLPHSFVWKKQAPANQLQVKLWQRLEQLGFNEWLIYELIHDIQPDENDNQAWQNILRTVTHNLSISPSDKLKRGGIFAMVGPTGAGKTTTIAKMAVRYVLEHEGHQVGLITMDNYRLAAHDQLKTLGQILGVPVQVADDEHPLTKCIENLSECDLILIDTAGLTPDHPMLSYQLDQIKQLGPTVNTLLTLPATSHSRVLRKVYHNYKAAGLSGCVLTKLDEASCLGDAISVLLEHEIPLSYSTDGQRIPDDFHVADAKSLVRSTVQIAQQEQQMAREATPMANHG